MNKKVLFSFIILSCTLNARTNYNNGYFNNFKEENLTKVKYDTRYQNNEGVIGKNGNEGKWPGVGPNGEAEGTYTLRYTRIPSMIITNDNKLIVMYDLRWQNPDLPDNTARNEKIGADHGRIDQGISISEDGGKTWKTKTGIKFDDVWKFGKKTEPQKYRRRLMDPTLIYNYLTDEIISLHGSWNEFAGGNWHVKRNDYYNKEIWAALMHKSKDGGKTWERTHKFDKNNNNIFINHTPDNPLKAFLGGVGTGIVMRDGTLVMPVQTSHQASSGKKAIGATIMYSYDNGKTWQMPKIDNSKILMPNGSSLENMVFQMGDKLILTGRGIDSSNNIQKNNVQRDNKHRWAYYTTDMGQTWKKFEPLHTFQTVTSQASQGSTLYVTLPSGKKVILVSAPDGNGNDGYKRGNLSLYVLSGKNKDQKKKITTIRSGSGNGLGAGYSSLAYKGGNLFVAYEDAGDISVKNLTDKIAEIEKAATEWNLEDERSKDIETVKKLKSLSEEQKQILTNEMMKDNDRAFTEAMVLDKELKEIDENVKKYKGNMSEAIPSNIRKFNESLEGLKEKNTMSKALHAMNLNYIIKTSGENLNQKIDFEPYKLVAKKFIYYRRDVINNDDRIFASYGRLTNGVEEDFRFGYNHSISNFKLGGFFEVFRSVNNSKNISVGATFKTVLNNKYTFKNFVRYRQQSLSNIKINDKSDKYNDVIVHNVDIYSSYENKFNLNKNLSITPKAGLLLTYSSGALLDEDAKLDKRISASSDFSVKAEAYFRSFKFKIKPEIMLLDNTQYISQSNLETKKAQIGSKIFEYNIQLGMGTKINGLNFDIDLDFNNIETQKTNVELRFGVGYSW